jgi:hypothetical protein
MLPTDWTFLVNASDNQSDQIKLPFISTPTEYEDLYLKLRTANVRRVFLITKELPPYKQSQKNYIQHTDPDASFFLRAIRDTILAQKYIPTPNPNIFYYKDQSGSTLNVWHFTHGVWGLPCPDPALVFITQNAFSKSELNKDRLEFLKTLLQMNTALRLKIRILCTESDMYSYNPEITEIAKQCINVEFIDNRFEVELDRYYHGRIGFTHDFRFEDHLFKIKRSFISPFIDPRVLVEYTDDDDKTISNSLNGCWSTLEITLTTFYIQYVRIKRVCKTSCRFIKHIPFQTTD